MLFPTIRNLRAGMFVGLIGALVLPVAADQRPAPGLWGPQGDGTFVNPILPGDFSDLDVIRVGDTYVAITSTFQFSPGMTVLTSRDLVTWRIVGNAVPDLTQIGPKLNWDRMQRAARGIWAGSIRYHQGRYRVYFGTPDEGYFTTSAPTPAGPWEPLVCLLSGGGWDDCCPFWDDDGQGWFIGTHFRDNYAIWLWKMTPDGLGLIEDSKRMVHQSKGSEANKLFKHDGWYFHYFSEDRGGDGRVAMMRRARSLEGPWEMRQLNRAKPVDPNQGGFVTAPDGTWWFFTHFGTGNWTGRSGNLLPVTWVDGWPVPGTVAEEGIGTMAWRPRLPLPLAASPRLPTVDDRFDGPGLDPCWQWNYQPRSGFWSLGERPGFLRLKAFPPAAGAAPELKRAGNTLTQRSFGSAQNMVTVAVDLAGMVDGQKAGLCHFSVPWSLIGVEQTAGVRRVVRTANDGRKGSVDQRDEGPVLAGTRLWLRSTWGANGVAQDAFSLDGTTYTHLGATLKLAFAEYRGDRIGVVTYNPTGEAGWLDVDEFIYQTATPSGVIP